MNLIPWISGTFLWILITGIVCLFKKNNGLVDIFWGLGFILLASVSFLFQSHHSTESIVVSALVLVWGIRLSIYLYSRNWNRPEDFRYASWRTDWGKHWVLFSILKVYLLQAVVMQVIAIPIFVTNVMALNGPTSVSGVLESVFIVMGATIAFMGICIEAIADRQKSDFKSDAKNNQKICKVGLWKISRHPNYLGEILTWTGLGIVPVGLPCGWISLIAPVAIILLLYFVSGVPLLEKRLEGRLDFEEYKKNTGAIFPKLFK